MGEPAARPYVWCLMGEQLAGREFHITGVVQGVGFRPFVYGLALEHELTGWVRNTSAGVDIVVNGRMPSLDSFSYDLEHKLPPLARIDSFAVQERPSNGYTQFEIIHSEPIAGAFQPISPDVSLCPDCLRELFDPNDRRYLYPFINCTNCGPRFTIIEDIPYDRPKTTMAPFEMCPACAAEYHDPLDRRFHAQPVACPDCGPSVWLQVAGCKLQDVSEDHASRITHQAIENAQKLLAGGKIVAIKGLGGFHLACDALNDTAVSTLRERKNRVDKPFAVMMADVETVEKYCFVNEAERELLTSRERPIVLLNRRPNTELSANIAPKQKTIGVMLPYTPLHHLLLTPAPQPLNSPAPILVMTSGNLSEEPIAYTNEDALERLSSLADAFLLHNRDIHMRCDDSVVRSAYCVKNDSRRTTHYVLRRSRGYAPNPIKLNQSLPSILATGAELKNTFCLTRDNYAFISHHIGDLENYETLCSFEEGIAHFEKLFRIRPELIAYDKHPNYLATRYALERAERDNIPAIGIQHHHAHIAACMAEHGLMADQLVIGVALDGTGYGDDGTIWGGEFLVADYAGYERPYSLNPIPLPGGDTAVRQPWRIALAYLHQAGISWEDDLPPLHHASRIPALSNAEGTHYEKTLSAIQHQLRTGLNAPLTSSMGRLFDGVSALLGVRQAVNYEAQAAIELEMLVDGVDRGVYDLHVVNGRIDPAPMFRQIVDEMRSGTETAVMATRFHNTISWLVVHICQRIRQETGLNDVVLSGGVWQNMTLLQQTIPQLDMNDFNVYWHTNLPANDGGLALGQAMIAANHSSLILHNS